MVGGQVEFVLSCGGVGERSGVSTVSYVLLQVSLFLLLLTLRGSRRILLRFGIMTRCVVGVEVGRGVPVLSSINLWVQGSGWDWGGRCDNVTFDVFGGSVHVRI